MSVLKAYFAERRGRLSLLAANLGISTAAVKKWDTVPCDRVVEVADLTGIPPHILRPDLYRDYVQANPERTNGKPRRAKVARVQGNRGRPNDPDT